MQDFQRKIINRWGKLSIFVDGGSLYKCFKCGKGELSDDEVELIKEITRYDVGVCGDLFDQFLNPKCRGTPSGRLYRSPHHAIIF